MKRMLFLLPIIAMTAFAAAPGGETTDEKLERLFDSFFRRYIQLDPESAAQLGDLSSLGYTYRRDCLTDNSEEAQTAFLEFLRSTRNELAACDLSGAGQPQRTAAEILMQDLDYILGGERFRHHAYVPNHLFGIHPSLTDLLTEYHPVETEQDARDYLGRLAAYPRRFDQECEQVRIRAREGLLPAKYLMDLAATEMEQFIADGARTNILCTSFEEKLGSCRAISPALRSELLRRAEDAVAQQVYPAYRRYLECIREARAKAPESGGVRNLPQGKAYYRYCLNLYTTTSATPDQVHELGLREVERIQQDALRILHSLGYPEGQSFAETYRMYLRSFQNKENDQFYYPPVEESREKILRDFRAHVDTIGRRLPECFSVLPKAPVLVEAMPRYKENVMPPNYQPGTLDGKKKGIFFIRPSPPGFKPGMKTLTVHEAIPGHHFQIAIGRESPVYRMFMNLFFNSGFGEGWALYAERLAREQGWFGDPYTELGYLNSEMFRAGRLVLDSGIHDRGWNRERALQYMKENLGFVSTRELDRYFIMPGQACAYKIGELKILELRERARKELGAKFDLKEFHRRVLQNGSEPLDILEKEIDRYIREAGKQ